jgi:hypothetical protein
VNELKLRIPQCAGGDCDGMAVAQVEIEDTGWHWYCAACTDSLRAGGFQVREADLDADVAAAESWRNVVEWLEDFYMRPDGEDRQAALEKFLEKVTTEVFE